MMLSRNVIILALLSLVCFSCERSIDPFVGIHEKKLVINAEVQPGAPIYLFVSTSVGIGEEDSPYRPEDFEQFDANIIINGNIEAPEEILYFEKEENDGGGLSWRTRRAFSTAVNQTLELNANLQYEDLTLSASAQTTIPRPLIIDTTVFIGQESLYGQDKYFYRVEIDVLQEELSLYENFHLQVSHNNEYLELSHFGNNESAVEHPHHHYGVFIHGDKLNSNKISFLIESEVELDSASIDLRNCTDSYMDYHVSLSRSYASQNSPFNEPTLSYSNVSNGLGVFCAYASYKKLVNFQ